MTSEQSISIDQDKYSKLYSLMLRLKNLKPKEYKIMVASEFDSMCTSHRLVDVQTGRTLSKIINEFNKRFFVEDDSFKAT